MTRHNSPYPLIFRHLDLVPLIPTRPGRTAPRTRKRGHSNRYERRTTNTPTVQTVTYRIIQHSLRPQPT
jgi:hypothetical protein